MKRRELNETRQCLLGVKYESDLTGRERPLQDIGFIGFHNPPPERLCIGDLPLKKYLMANNISSVLRLREFLSGLDWSSFAAAYTGRGRKPGHPMLFLGLIIYGMLEGKWSLRELERLAIRDLGAWWICGGLQPDHSTIGNFINLHADLLTEKFFIDLTRKICRLLNLSPGDVAGDGTIIESAGSRFEVLKAEAAREAARAARARAEENPEDAGASRQAERAEAAVGEADRRHRKARKNGNGKGQTEVCITDPEAPILKTKNGRGYRPSYKPSILADKHRIIQGQNVHPSNENLSVDPMLDQYRQVAGALPARMMFDAGYFNFAMFERSIELDIDLLCPSGRSSDRNLQKRSRKGRFLKGDFIYDRSANEYICPANRRLKSFRTDIEKGLSAERYLCRECADCEQREKCTGAKQGRTITRYGKDDLKEAMAEVMRHPAARAAYKKRQAMVEPVFSVLRGRQGLNRFRRFGGKKVKLEFSLHCIAYNVGRLLRLERAFGLICADISLDYHNDRPIIRLKITIFLLTP